MRALLGLAVAAVVACDDGTSPVTPTGEVVEVFTPGEVFTPFTAEIGVGGVVRWHISRAPDGDGHNAIFNPATPGAPEDINVVADTVIDRLFTRRGTFHYVCTVHPGMAGEVVVQ
jgi:plastocyanin